MVKFNNKVLKITKSLNKKERKKKLVCSCFFRKIIQMHAPSPKSAEKLFL